MNFNFKRLILIFFITNISTAQELANEASQNITFRGQIRLGTIVPAAFGSQNYSDAFTYKVGFTGEFLYYFNDRFFIGYQNMFYNSEVVNTALVGLYNQSTARRHFVTAGYSFFPAENNFDISSSIGIGLVNYKNKKENTKFYDNGFSLMADTKATYRFSDYIGFFVGAQVSHDFLNIKTAPEIQDIFKKGENFYFSAGLVIYIGS
jgi:hypothetical protein